MYRPIRGALAISSLRRAVAVLALCAATSCVLRPPSLTAGIASLPSGGGPPPDPATAPTDDNQVIDAGCSLTGNDIKGEPGSLHQLSCPAGCEKHDAKPVGTDMYAGLSPVCISAIHAGAIPARGGQATLMLESSKRAFRGSKRYGVESIDWGEYRGAFRFPGVVAAAPPPPAPTGPVSIDAGCTFTANEINNGEPGMMYRVTCPAGCNAEKPAIYGTDHYTGHSRICVAAIHAGVSTDRGGEFFLVLEEGRPAYRGEKRNGVLSYDDSAHRRSYRFQR